MSDPAARPDRCRVRKDLSVGVKFGLLGPVTAQDAGGSPLRLGPPRHREVLGRLLIARGRVVPVGTLVADLWGEEPVPGAVGAVRTFVAGLRRCLEPDRPARQASQLLVTDGPGYALRAGREAVDAWRFEDTATRAAATPPSAAVVLFDQALALWRGPVLADFPTAGWAAAEQARLEALRLDAVERRADALLATGAAGHAVADLRAHVTAHPGRQDGWVLLANALARTGQRTEALQTLSHARTALAGAHGTPPGHALDRAEARIIDATDCGTEPAGITDSLWERAAASWDRSVPARSQARLHATAGLLRDLAVTGPEGLEQAHQHRRDLVAAAETSGDTELAARIIGSYDVPAVWTRADHPDSAGELSRAAARAAAQLGPQGPAALRARLLSVMAIESRGDAAADTPVPRAAQPRTTEPWRRRAEQAAEEAVRLARGLGDAALLAFALNGAFMQAFSHCGSAARREVLGAELTRLSAEHQMPSHEILGRIIRLQALAGLGDLAEADAEAEQIDRLARRNERPLAEVFTSWYRALRTSETDGWSAARPQYEHVLKHTADSGMPGLTQGAAALVALVPVLRDDASVDTAELSRLDAGPYQPWLNPLLLAARGATEQAHQALTTAPRPPHDHLQEALWAVLAKAALLVGHLPVLRRAREELAAAQGERSAGSGLVSFGPVLRHLEAIDVALDAHNR